MSNNAGTYDLGPDGKTILVASMNAKEGSDFQVSDFVFSDPIALTYTDPLTGLTTNTQIKLKYVANASSYGVKTIHYNRISATDFGSLSFIPLEGGVVADLLPFINKRFGVDIKPFEIINPQASLDKLVNYKLQFNDDCIVFRGSNDISLALPGNRLYTWGKGGQGLNGNGTFGDILAPTFLSTGWKLGYKTFSSSYNHTLAIKEDGTLWAWGDNSYGKLGLGYEETGTNVQSTPIQVGTDTDWKMVSAGGLSSIALKNDGSFWGWGLDSLGSLSGFSSFSPVIIVPGVWIDICAPYDSSIGIRSDGTFWGTGNNSSGQLGNGNYRHQPKFVQELTLATDWLELPELNNASNYVIILKTNRELYYAGDPYLSGVVPWNFRQYYPFRQSVPGPWKEVVGSSGHCLGVKTDGTLWSWGYNSSGQLGDGSTNYERLFAQQIGKSANWVSVSAGYEHSTALNSLGELYVFGGNRYGQLGTGTRIGSNSPQLIQTNILQINSREEGMYALTVSVLPDNIIPV